MAYSATFTVAPTNTLDQAVIQNLDATSATQLEPYLGKTVRSRDGRKYTYVYLVCSDVAMVAGAPCVWEDTTADWVVTTDCSDAGGAGNGFAGLVTVAETDPDRSYIWIQTRPGRAEAAIVDADVAANDGLVVDAGDKFTTVSPFDSTSYSTEQQVGFALTDAYDNGVTTASRADIILT
jgi:hypothetical protein